MSRGSGTTQEDRRRNGDGIGFVRSWREGGGDRYRPGGGKPAIEVIDHDVRVLAARQRG